MSLKKTFSSERKATTPPPKKKADAQVRLRERTAATRRNPSQKFERSSRAIDMPMEAPRPGSLIRPSSHTPASVGTAMTANADLQPATWPIPPPMGPAKRAMAVVANR